MEDEPNPAVRLVPAAQARELIALELGPLIPDMEVVREGVWARSLTNEIRAVIAVSPLKGAQYDIEYGGRPGPS